MYECSSWCLPELDHSKTIRLDLRPYLYFHLEGLKSSFSSWTKRVETVVWDNMQYFSREAGAIRASLLPFEYAILSLREP